MLFWHAVLASYTPYVPWQSILCSSVCSAKGLEIICRRLVLFRKPMSQLSTLGSVGFFFCFMHFQTRLASHIYSCHLLTICSSFSERLESRHAAIPVCLISAADGAIGDTALSCIHKVRCYPIKSGHGRVVTTGGAWGSRAPYISHMLSLAPSGFVGF